MSQLMERAGISIHSPFFQYFAVLRDFAQIDLRIEVRGEGLAVVAGIAVHDVDIFDLVEQMLLRIGAVDVRHAGVEAAAENGGNALLLEAVVIGPLPVVLELRHIARLIVRGVHIVAAGFEAGIHDRQVLIGQGHVDQEVRLHLFDEGDHFRHIVGIDLRNLDRRFAERRHFLAAFEAARGERDVLERVAVHRAFLGDDRTGSAGTDDKNAVHDGKASKTLRGS